MTGNVAVVFDENGIPLMVVVPNNDEQLRDPSFNPPGSTQVLVPLETYQISSREELADIVAAALEQIPPDSASESPV